MKGMYDECVLCSFPVRGDLIDREAPLARTSVIGLATDRVHQICLDNCMTRREELREIVVEEFEKAWDIPKVPAFNEIRKILKGRRKTVRNMSGSKAYLQKLRGLDAAGELGENGKLVMRRMERLLATPV